MSEVQEITTEDFESKVLGVSGPVLIDFWATWCPPCKQYGPIVEQFASEHGDKITVYKMDTDQNPEIAQRYGISSIPTTIVFKGGEADTVLVGARPKLTLVNELSKYLG